MTARRLLRAVSRPLKRLFRSWRLAHNRYQVMHSIYQVERLNEARSAIADLVASEHRKQVQLEMDRRQIESAL